MLTAVLSLSAAFAYTVHDYLMMRVVRATPVLTALFWVQLVGLAILLPLWLVFASAARGTGRVARGRSRCADRPDRDPRPCLPAQGPRRRQAVGGRARWRRWAEASAPPSPSRSGEPVAPLAVIGLPLAVIGAVLASIERSGENGRQVKATAGAGWGLLCALVWGIEPILISEASLLPALSVVTIGRVSSLLLLAPLTACSAASPCGATSASASGACAVADVAGFIAWVAATAIGPVATASVLSAQTGTMSAAFGMAVLRERPSRVQVAGIVATVAAVTLLALSGSG